MDIWTLSLDGNNATRRQVVGLATALQAMLGADETTVQPIQVNKPANAVTLPNNTIVTWTTVPDTHELKNLTCSKGSLNEPWPDLVVACRPEVAAVALAIKAASGGQTQIVQIQDPNDKTGTYNFDRGQFDLIVKQSQEAVTGANVIASQLPLHDLTRETLAQWREEGLEKLPKYRTEPATVVLIGGSDEHVSLDANDFANFGADIAKLAVNAGDIFVLSSRRTTEEQKAAFMDAIKDSPNVFFDDPRLSYNNALGIGSSFVSDAGSGSMGAEVEFTGAPWSFYSYRGKLQEHPQMLVWPEVKAAELPMFGPPQPVGAANEAPAIARQVVELLHLPVKATTASNDLA